MDERVEHILEQIPGWSGKDLVVAPLLGGVTNQNYRVDVAGETFVLRVGGKGTRLLGIDRGREHICTAIAAQLGIGAEVMHFLASEDALVTRFIVGAGISPETAAEPGTLRRIIASMKRYHGGPAFPDTLPRVYALMEQIEEAIGPLDQPRPCHNDLLASNFIDDGDRIWILDWEYAAMGDMFFDLGNFAVNQELNEEQCEELLRYYFGEVRDAELAHLHLMRLGSDLRESFWGFLQMGVSELDFDYHEYAHHHLERFLQNVVTPEFTRWLRDLTLSRAKAAGGLGSSKERAT